MNSVVDIVLLFCPTEVVVVSMVIEVNVINDFVVVVPSVYTII